MGLRHNINTLPEGWNLPATFEGEKGQEEPLHVAQGMIPEDSDEVIYKVLCKSGNYVNIPESKLSRAIA